ncbi:MULTISPECIES: molybdate ABC transporter permease subunit [Halanaerobium]|uniref:Molybdate transport system permease protein n=1 Tax=Halanaerobium kushneri TaxID=56779 RepID=A0A1N6Y5L4_9FIRM|nr:MULTISPECIES: ABC transporter permease subunit [Halanaerobium]RCW52473.1 molybdate transport system permease protein [Halanaerobium sp. ST460_2HS_T2]SIR09922.1 molybdate transport system permease protein [Halanaerobium kushneri]
MSKDLVLDTENQKRKQQRISLFPPDYFSKPEKFTFSDELLILIPAVLSILFISLIILSLFVESSAAEIISIFKSMDILSAFKITFLSLSISALLTIVLGVPFSYFSSRKNRNINKVINIVISLPLLLPPSITGLALLLTFGSRGILSKLTDNLAFTFTALIIVQVFVMLPLFIHTLKNSFAAVNKNIIEAALVEGAAEKDLLFKVYLPLSGRGFITALIISVLRAAGEFGATIIFAGNMSGKTQTLTTAIYSLSQTNITQAIALAVIMLSAFLLPLFLLEFKIREKT